MSSSGLMQTFMQIRPALHRFLIARGTSAAEAEDVLQEISLRLSTDAIGPVADPRAYLYKMASNQFQLHRRTEQRRTRREEDWVDSTSEEMREIDPGASAELQLIQREQIAILRAALDGLPERTRWVFLQFRVEGEAQKQIAATLGISVSAVEKHLTRAYGAIASTKLLLDGDHALPRHLRQARGRHEH
ncbi:RNA polymerase sigma factor [Sphingopyxis panaciterrae]|uniref:RNA polymerase sigma factor n=1 Tax=Sphingopyxis panaciterrae TaxID=363841 RepID=UPI001ABA7A93|nr:RNA polymerase sigma factor [Sphingopyxis panaciterrae]